MCDPFSRALHRCGAMGCRRRTQRSLLSVHLFKVSSDSTVQTHWDAHLGVFQWLWVLINFDGHKPLPLISYCSSRSWIWPRCTSYCSSRSWISCTERIHKSRNTSTHKVKHEALSRFNMETGVLVNELTNRSVQFHCLEDELTNRSIQSCDLGDEFTNMLVQSHRLEDKLTNRSVLLY
jgi:hypothetical protein